MTEPDDEVENVPEDDNSKFSYNENDRTKWKNNCRPDIGAAVPEEQRERLAQAYGPNWANIMAGLGDQ
jgi:hypothetical protein